uniref:Uncharacterized protein n=1 Tax=Phytophthora ramorum TaxID=164328 RepID=H3GDI3_PHYRM
MLWFSWYAHDRRWQAAEPKRQRSKAKLLVAFMKLFLTDGFVLDPAGDGYRNQMLELGKRAEEGAMTYLGKHNIKSRGSSAVLKHHHTPHPAGALNAEIQRHQRLF